VELYKSDYNEIVWFSDKLKKDYYDTVNEALAYGATYEEINPCLDLTNQIKETFDLLENKKHYDEIVKNKSYSLIENRENGEPLYKLSYFHDGKNNGTIWGPSAREYSYRLRVIMYKNIIEGKKIVEKNNKCAALAIIIQLLAAIIVIISII